MKNIIYIISCLLLGVLFINSSRGRASQAREGNTGAPGDNFRVCEDCHGSTFDMDIDIRVLDAQRNDVEFYQPNEQYTVQVNLTANSGNPSLYGFQLTALLEEGVPYAAWSQPSDNVKIVELNSRSYVEHFTPSRENVMEVSWKAPDMGKGEVSFYAAGIGANGNASTGGDGADNTKLSLNPMVSNATELNNLGIQRVGSNIAESYISYTGIRKNTQVSVYDHMGRLMVTMMVNVDPLELDLSSYNSGVYHICFENAARRAIDQVLKW